MTVVPRPTTPPFKLRCSPSFRLFAMAPSTSSFSAAASRWSTVDRVIIGSFALFFTIGVFVDYINAFAPVGGVTPATASTWSWPPAPVWPLYFWWCRVCDPVLQLNPLWIKYLSILSPVVFCPFYLVAIYAIAQRRAWIRIPCVMYASVLFVDLSAFFVEAIWGDLPSPNLWIFTAGYGYYQLFPLLVLWRFWNDNPFGAASAAKKAN